MNERYVNNYSSLWFFFIVLTCYHCRLAEKEAELEHMEATLKARAKELTDIAAHQVRFVFSLFLSFFDFLL